MPGSSNQMKATISSIAVAPIAANNGNENEETSVMYDTPFLLQLQYR